MVRRIGLVGLCEVAHCRHNMHTYVHVACGDLCGTSGCATYKVAASLTSKEFPCRHALGVQVRHHLPCSDQPRRISARLVACGANDHVSLGPVVRQYRSSPLQQLLVVLTSAMLAWTATAHCKGVACGSLHAALSPTMPSKPSQWPLPPCCHAPPLALAAYGRPLSLPAATLIAADDSERQQLLPACAGHLLLLHLPHARPGSKLAGSELTDTSMSGPRQH
jgi:hypothetical protein